MKILSYIDDNNGTRIFTDLLNKVGDGSIEFVNYFTNPNSSYDYSIGINDTFPNTTNKISLIMEAISHASGIWTDFERWSSKFSYVVNWNKKITSKNSIYFPFIFFHIAWEEDMFDKNGNFVFFNEKKEYLLSFASSNKSSQNLVKDLYKERINCINKFADRIKENNFHIYGNGWEKYGDYSKGMVRMKSDTMKKYKFSIVFENQTDDNYYTNGYATEKIYDALRCHTIPIYWGCPNITELVPADCFIDYKALIDNGIDVVEYVTNMPDEEYCKYVNNIDNFLHSKNYFNIAHPLSFYNTLKDKL